MPSVDINVKLSNTICLFGHGIVTRVRQKLSARYIFLHLARLLVGHDMIPGASVSPDYVVQA